MFEVRGTIKSIPNWWMEALAHIDPTYYPVYHQEYDYFTIMKKVVYFYEEGGKLRKVERESPLATFRNLNDAALDNLRARKEVGRKFERSSNPTAYLDWIVGEGREAKKKAIELSLEMQAEGYMKMYKMEHSKTFP